MTAGHGSKRPRQEAAALAALLSRPTIAEAATQAGISESTLLRWLAEPEFKARAEDARRRVVEGSIWELQQAAAAAITGLREIAEDAGVPPSARVAAWGKILDCQWKHTETNAAARLAEIEKTLERMPKSP